MRTRVLCSIAIGFLIGCAPAAGGRDPQARVALGSGFDAGVIGFDAGVGSGSGSGSGLPPGPDAGVGPGSGFGSDAGVPPGPDAGAGSGSGSGSGSPTRIEVDPIEAPTPYLPFPDDDLECALTPTTPTCGACDADDPYCDSYGPPEPGPSSICGEDGETGGDFVSCDGPSTATPKTYLLPSEYTKSIHEVFYAYPVSGRGAFATLPEANSALLPPPKPADGRGRISQAQLSDFLLRSMTAATGKRTTDFGGLDQAATDLVQVTVVTNSVDGARADIIAQLKKPLAQGGLALSQADAEAMVGNATDASYRGAGKIRLLAVTGLQTIWMRDFGPHIIQLRTGGTKNAEQVILDFGYHGDRAGDDAVPSRIYAARATLWPGATVSYIDANRGDAQIQSGGAASTWTADGTMGATNGLQEEGGNLHSDGVGSCLTTWKNLAPDTTGNGDDGGFAAYFNANAKMVAADQRTRLHKLLGCDYVTVLPRLPYDYNLTTDVGTGDGTGHVDMLAHYYGHDQVLLAESELGDANCAGYPANYIGQFNRRTCEALVAAKAELIRTGHKDADIKRVPILDYSAAKRSARSTTNIMEVGNRVLYVTYGTMTAAQKTALRTTLAAAYGGTRQLFELDASAIIEIGGAVHCTTIGFQDL